MDAGKWMGAGLQCSGALMQTDVSAAVCVCRRASVLNMKGTSLGMTTCVLLLTTVAPSVGLMKTSTESSRAHSLAYSAHA